MIRISRARCFQHSGGLAQTVGNARTRWTRRAGLVYEIGDDSGVTGQGEASPLPGYSAETLADCRAALESSPGLGKWVPRDGSGFELVTRVALEPPLPPAARCAFEGALVDLVARHQGCPAWRLFATEAASLGTPRPLSVLLPAGSPATVVSAAVAARRRGAACLKLKIGTPGALEQEIVTVRAIRDAVSDVTLRLDANRSFLAAEAALSLARFAAFDCELVEEPLTELDLGGLVAGDVAALRAAQTLAMLPIPFALDESLQSAPPGALTHLTRIAQPSAVMLKPMVLGGISRSLRLAAEARQLGIDVILTHSFDGPLGLQTAATLAVTVGSPTRAQGLALHPGLTAWPPRSPPGVTDRAVVAWSAPGLAIAPLAGDTAP